jgi:hypothetical protein
MTPAGREEIHRERATPYVPIQFANVMPPKGGG